MLQQLEHRRRRRRDLGESGFTLLEVIVALLVLGIAASGTVLLLATSSRAALASRLDTQAKDLSSQRVEAMRDLQFHVDRQNGPYIDLLDIYYTNLSTTATTRTRGAITDSDQLETQTVRWFASGTAPNPTSGPFFQVSVSSVPGYSQFSQVIDTQFLSSAGTALPASSFTGSGTYSQYNSQTQGKDSPPTSLVNVTVITSWRDHGVAKRYALTTQITDSRGTRNYITSQGVAELVRLTSAGTGGEADALTVDVNRAEADGSQTTGSSATASATAFEATDTGQNTDVVGATGNAASPGSASTTFPPSPGYVKSMPSTYTGSNVWSCGWATGGNSTVANVTASTANGLPRVPSTVGSSETAPSAVTSSSLFANTGENSDCDSRFGRRWAVWFDNQSPLSSLDTRLKLDTAASNVYPLVGIPDSNPPGNPTVTTGGAWVNASSDAASPHWVSSGASLSSATGASINPTVALFPGLPFVTADSDGVIEGLVNITITSASITCKADVASGSGVTLGATASYDGTLKYWDYNKSGGPGYQTVALHWSSTDSSTLTDQVAAIPLSTVVYQNSRTNPDPTQTLRLSDYISNWSSSRAIIEDANNGLHQLPGVVDITTKPVRSGDVTSSIGVELGNLSCVAVDDR